MNYVWKFSCTKPKPKCGKRVKEKQLNRKLVKTRTKNLLLRVNKLLRSSFLNGCENGTIKY